MANLDKKNVRYNVLTIIVYIVGIIMIVQLFNLQIVHGEEYLEKSNLRLTRENTIKAARGNIKDCNGNILAGTTVRYSSPCTICKLNSCIIIISPTIYTIIVKILYLTFFLLRFANFFSFTNIC